MYFCETPITITIIKALITSILLLPLFYPFQLTLHFTPSQVATDLFSVTVHLHLLEVYINRIIQYVLLLPGSFSIIILRSISVVAYINTCVLLLLLLSSSPLYRYIKSTLSICLLRDIFGFGVDVGFFPLIHKAAMNVCVQVFL